MFEHLDDDAPPALDRDVVVARGRRLRRRRRLGRAVAGAGTAVVATVAALTLYVDRRDAAIDRVDIAAPPTAAGDEVNVLLVGVDGSGLDGPVRADTLVVVRFRADGTVAATSVPRDLVAGSVEERMAVRAGAGPAAAAEAVRDLGIPVDHVVQVDFTGFVAVVDAVGGVAVRVERPIVDPMAGTNLQPSPCTVLDGTTALTLVRARHVTGDEAAGDFGRMARQRAFLLAALAQTGAADVDAVSRALADHAVLDEGLTLARLVELGRRLDAVVDVEAVALPTQSATIGNGAVVLVPADGFDEAAGSFAGGPEVAPIDHPPPGIGPCA